MIHYRYLSKEELLNGNTVSKVDDDEPFKESSLRYMDRYPPDEIVAILAEDGEQLVGRIFLAYSEVLVNGQLLRCTVGSNLFVKKSYRKKAVGIKLLGKVIQLGNPYIAASVSGDLYPVLEASKRFCRIDDSPVYTIGLNFGGILRTARLALQTEEKKKAQAVSKTRQAWVVATKFFHRNRINVLSDGRLSVLNPDKAVAQLDKIKTTRDDRIFIPWNRNVIYKALHGEDKHRFAWVVALQDGDVEQHYFVSLYMGQRKVSLIHSRDIRNVLLARLVEIFPPVKDKETTRHIIAFAFQQARILKASLLFVYAMNDTLTSTCENLKFDHFIDKRVFLAPGELDKELAEKLTTRKNWWCRAINESQFEETYKPQVQTDIEALAKNSELI